jgi:adenine C2-methylase RlmN of 23S rRNA A2503 and tRNA A37
VQVFVEYVMLAKVNDSEEQAHQLGALLQGRAVVLNLIPWNPVYSPEFDFKAPGHQRTETFQTIVRQYGVHCTVRQEKGQDISGSCYVGHGFMCTAAIHLSECCNHWLFWAVLRV